MGSGDPEELSGFGVVGRVGLFQADAAKPLGLPAWVVETVALSCPQGLLARQAAQDSHPDNVIPVKITPIKAILGFVPIGFSFLPRLEVSPRRPPVRSLPPAVAAAQGISRSRNAPKAGGL